MYQFLMRATFCICRIDAQEPDFGVTCMHGREECAGNVQQLCAFKYADRSNWWEFVQCQNYQGRENVGRADVALKCADAAGIDWSNDGTGQCAGMDGSGTGSEGAELLKESVLHGQKLEIRSVLLPRITIILDSWMYPDRPHCTAKAAQCL